MKTYAHLEWKQTSDKSFRVYYEWQSRKIQAEAIEGVFEHGGLNYGLMAKKDGKYSLYLKSLVNIDNVGNRTYKGCYKFDNDILEYREVGCMLIYKKEDGWYAVKYDSVLWHLHFKDVLHKRLKGTTKFCSADVQILAANSISFEYDTADILYTTDGIFFLYGMSGCINSELPVGYVHCYKYTKIKGYKRMVRMYLDKDSRYFVVGYVAGDYVMKPENVTTDKCLALKDVGNGYFIMCKGKQKKLIFLDDVYYSTLVNWGKHEIAKIGTVSGHFCINGNEVIFNYER